MIPSHCAGRTASFRIFHANRIVSTPNKDELMAAYSGLGRRPEKVIRLIAKASSGIVTKTSVVLLDSAGRQEEIARIATMEQGKAIAQQGVGHPFLLQHNMQVRERSTRQKQA